MPAEYDENFYWELITRQKDIINKKEQLKVKNSKITVIGCGGIGGATIEMLARMGAENLTIVDKDSFDVSNLNRQLVSSMDNIGNSKAQSTRERILSINPHTAVEVFDGKLDQENVKEIIGGSVVVIDALDNLISRVVVSRSTYELQIPFVHGSVHGTMGQITTFTRETPQYEDIFKLPSFNRDLTDEIISKIRKLNINPPPVIGPVPNIVGCLQSFEALKLITSKGSPVLSPEVLMFDLMNKKAFYIANYL